MQRVFLATVDIHRAFGFETIARDAAYAADGGDRHCELGVANLYEHRLRDCKRLRQTQGERGALAGFGGDFQRTAELANFAVDHVHANATTGELADGVGRTEAGFQDQAFQRDIGERHIRLHHATLFGAAADRGMVEASAVIGHLQHHFRAFATQCDLHRAFFRLAALAACLG